MLSKLITYLKYEEQLLKDLFNLAERQQNALIKMKLEDIGDITSLQEEISGNLRKAEDNRLTIIANWLKITKQKATQVKLSELAKLCNKNEETEINNLKESMNLLMSELHLINTSNRVLTNRARHSVKEMIEILTNGTNNVCNVRV
ncbi:MAG: flagellar export chaperone FlgN [Desulfobulbaceae bacterium]|nr:flagellar export chaperone FlgN [Candidatus Kapabacteria bacterium]MBS4000121.1 flagellar export chaperone FlgN [Desulfobulbaceae bacterium]